MGKKGKILMLLGVFSLRICLAASAILNRSTVDELSLLSMKANINSDILARNWSEATSFCIWTGITCGKKHTDRVTAINLSNMGLEGNIAKEIGNLSFLRYIDISNNSINGLIPGEIGNLRRLRVLRMAFNQLSGGIPPSLGSLRKLQGVNLSSNYLTGDIPTSLSACVELKLFDLSDNNLSGKFPTGVWNWSRLQEISLSRNSITVDVYSYGILLMEMLSRRKPTDEMFSGELTLRGLVSESFPDSVLQIVDNELLVTDDDEARAAFITCLTLVIGLALECTADLPEERPNMNDVQNRIATIRYKYVQMSLSIVDPERAG